MSHSVEPIPGSNVPHNPTPGTGPATHLQPACPAFSRWMQRRVLNKGAAGAVKSQPPLIANSGTSPNEEELTVAAIQELKQRLRCKNPLLDQFLQLLQQDRRVITAWITPLPRPDAFDPRLAQGVFGLAQSVVWVRPIDDIWRVALQAARDPSIQEYERELVFVATLTHSLLDDAEFRSGVTSEDLGLLELVRRARHACASKGADTSSAEMERQLHAQTSLLKSVLAPQSVDPEADDVNVIQFNRIRRAVEQAMRVLRLNWSEPEVVTTLAKTCLKPLRTTVSGNSRANRG